MAGFTSSVTIDRPRAEVFAFATDFRRVSSWIPQITEIVKLGDGPVGPGTRFRETRTMGQREATAELEIRAHEAPRIHAAGGKVMGVDCVYEYTFHEAGSGTRVDLECRAEGRWLGKLLAPMMAKIMKREDGDQLQRLKQAIERG